MLHVRNKYNRKRNHVSQWWSREIRRNLFHVGISLLGTDPAWLALDMVDVLVFCHSNKMPEANLDRERVYFGSAFWRFQSTVNWFCGFGSVVRNQAMAEYVMEQNKPLTSWLGSKWWKEQSCTVPSHKHATHDIKSSLWTLPLKSPAIFW